MRKYSTAHKTPNNVGPKEISQNILDYAKVKSCTAWQGMMHDTGVGVGMQTGNR